MADQRTYFFESCLGVFQGGGCRGAAFAGAIEHVAARGVNFSGLAGTSAGSIVAALLAAGATPAQLSEILNNLDFPGFLAEPDAIAGGQPPFLQRCTARFADLFYPGVSAALKHQGRYSSRRIEEWLNGELKKLLPNVTSPTVRFSDLPKPVWIVATDLVTRDVKIWSNDNKDDSVAYAVRCSCSIPGFFQAVDRRYVDGGLLSNLPSFAFSEDSGSLYARNILAFTLHSDTKASRTDTLLGYLGAIVNTAIDGASSIQARIVENVYEIKIPTGDIESTDFKGMNPDKVQELKTKGTDAARQFLNTELARVRSAGQRRICEGEDEILGELTTILNVRNVRNIFIAGDTSKWLYSIFPAFLKWRSQGVEVHAWLPADTQERHELYRRRLMIQLGIVIHSRDLPAFRGFLIDPQEDTGSVALIYVEETVSNAVRAIKYIGPDDQPVIRSLYNSLVRSGTPATLPRPTLQRGSDTELMGRLRTHVSPYAQADMQMETVPVAKLLALSRLVREYKYQQVKALHGMFKAAGFNPFDVAVVKYGSGQETIVTPPVVEAAGDDCFILIQGTTRAVFCVREGIESLRCLVVRKVQVALPSQQQTPIRDVLIGGRTLSTTDRYGQKIDAEFRPIELAVHHPDDTLLPLPVQQPIPAQPVPAP